MGGVIKLTSPCDDLVTGGVLWFALRWSGMDAELQNVWRVLAKLHLLLPACPYTCFLLFFCLCSKEWTPGDCVLSGVSCPLAAGCIRPVEGGSSSRLLNGGKSGKDISSPHPSLVLVVTASLWNCGFCWAVQFTLRSTLPFATEAWQWS